MCKGLLSVLLVISLCVVSHQNAESDWVDPDDLDLPHPFMAEYFFAGYLKANNKQFFYAYHQSQNNSRKDPVVIWLG